MKYSITHLVIVAGAVSVALCTGRAETYKRASAPLVITPAVVPDGSNYSRAPFPASRQQNDVTPPNGMAFDENLPPNTPSTTPEPLAPPVTGFAILQPRTAPGLTPTGRPTVAASAGLDPTQVEQSIRSTPFENRDNLVDNLRLRKRQTDTTLIEFDRTEGEMNPEGRSQFHSLSSEVKSRGRALDHSLRAAANASSADWDSAREQLVSSYDSYASAVAQVDAAVGIAPRR